ncbi:iron dicitrate transport regulator FecR [Chitinophaga caeni]|uniref:Iron dicitrate transport regulator FecR n=1 Tax=Chitinophaga caeni TaxID=2029983 RepID=A0A291QZD0_9BACT|nr:FecR family protein [Chitinophaga caeni]ATL49242.1 iron dicitrate transport regulator FecR [Chitinophaga caeni]
MGFTDQHIIELIHKHLQNNLSDEEQVILNTWVNASEQNRRIFESVTDPQELLPGLQQFYNYNPDKIAAKIAEQVPAFAGREVIGISRRKWWWAAAAAVLMIGAGLVLLRPKPPEPTMIVGKQAEISPGKQGAILTLSDGKQVVLDSLENGEVAEQNGTSVMLANGSLIYSNNSHVNAALAYNTMTTPKGRQFQVTLPDGTIAWLNAASSIRYPTTFLGNERRVEVDGEVYFEVAPDASKPFRVAIDNRALVEVLGTDFNVNAYNNENTITTTLVSGSVRVSNVLKNGVVLQPGQQAEIINAAKPDANIRVHQQVNLEKILAWKNGLFNFEGATLEEAMRQLERWYNIEVVYENGIPNITFVGEINRQMKLNDMLEILKRTDVDFKIDGRRLIVLNK